MKNALEIWITLALSCALWFVLGYAAHSYLSAPAEACHVIAPK